VRTAIFTIPAHHAFADALVAGLIERYGGGPTGLARGVVLLPNNRAVRAIQDAFVRRAGGGLLLPRLVPIGDPELGERIGGALEPIGGAEPIPPAIAPLERQMLLARLVERHRGVGAGEAMRLAADLARALDQLLVEEVALDRVARFGDDLSPELSAHWQASLDQLRLILVEWPEILRERGRIDLADRRRRLLDAVAARWRAAPPKGFVCAAGITTSAPAVARLLRVVANLPEGLVVLPALDLAMPEEEWSTLGPHEADVAGRRRPSIETHPQFHLKLLLDRMGVARGEVERWSRGGGHSAPAARGRAVANAMAPPAFTGKWLALKPAERRLTGVRALELADPAEEAQTIALALREALETPGRTAALVTPDRALARRVAAHLRRWGIEADDSAGRPLAQTPPGTLLLALATLAAERFSPVALLAVLEHPLVMAGEGRREWLEGARRLDLALRGPRPPAGIAGIDQAARADAAADAWWRAARPLLEPVETAFDGQGLPGALAVLRETAGRLSGDALWAGPAGRAASEFWSSLEECAALGPERIERAELPGLLEELMADVAVRPPYGQHPRISIWGLIEARLQRADLMILGGLNEGVWPALPAPDPWLAPKLRSALGLPSLERRIGLAAHDFAMALGAPSVLVTRARRDARSPTVASRLWLRLEALTGGVTRAPQLLKWAKAIDRPAGYNPARRPEPSPKVRPTRISVTEVDRLKADPYAFYARRVLCLPQLDSVGADPTPAWRGNQIHDILEAWMKEDDCDPDRLRARAQALLADEGVHPMTRALWQPRLMEAIDFIANQVAENRAAGRRPLKAEAKGEIEIAGVRLHGRADRIDRLADGSLAIVDYKTGQPPSTKAVREGYSLQLGLLGLIAERGGFDGIDGPASCFEYWSLARGQNGRIGFVKSPAGGRDGIDPADFTRVAADNFAEAAGRWLTGSAPFTAKLKPEYAPYGEYDQLMRLDEWYGRD
jgi:ATP-dependent helicase/nuclease subunit B